MGRNLLVLAAAALASGFADAPKFVEVGELHDPTPSGFNGSSYYGTAAAIGERFFVVGEPSGGFPQDPVAEVHVYFESTGRNLLPAITIRADEVGASDSFGIDVSAHGDRFAATDDSQTFVFRLDHGQWVLEAVLPYGGHSVSLTGRELAIGSWFTSTAAIYRLDAGTDANSPDDDTWLQDSLISGEYAELFAYRVSLSGDLLLIGAPWGTTGGAQTGIAYVFERAGDGWVQSAVLEPVGATADAEFGRSLISRGDLLLIGAPHDQPKSLGSAKGAAYVYRRDPLGSWASEGKLTVRGDEGALGYSLAMTRETVCVGALLAETGPNESFGAIYQFEPRRLADGSVTWRVVDKIVAVDPYPGGLGLCMASSGKTLLVGSLGPVRSFRAE